MHMQRRRGPGKQTALPNTVTLTDFKTQNILYILQLVIYKRLLVFIYSMLLFQSPASPYIG